jgi:hypothetical protein
MVPILWFTQSAELTDDLADLAKLLLSLPAIGMATFFGLAGIGALLIVSGIVITLRNGWEGDKDYSRESLVPVAPDVNDMDTDKEELQ